MFHAGVKKKGKRRCGVPIDHRKGGKKRSGGSGEAVIQNFLCPAAVEGGAEEGRGAPGECGQRSVLQKEREPEKNGERPRWPPKWGSISDHGNQLRESAKVKDGFENTGCPETLEPYPRGLEGEQLIFET